MPAEEHATARLSLRERRRAAATQEILDAAERHIVENGPTALSLRSVARELGMTVQALYHYFPSWSGLVTALITKAYDDLADAIQVAVDTAPEDPGLPRAVVAAEEYRRWAVTHPERFQLLFGTPLRQYAAPADGPTTQAMIRISEIFRREMFDGFTRAQLEAADAPALSPSLRAHLERLQSPGLGAAPAPATTLLLSAWGHLHGLVVLEVFGHTSFLGEHQAEIFRRGVRNLVEDVHRRIPRDGPGATATEPLAEPGFEGDPAVPTA
ncbi:TetR/AcrR family transcriptional regulator [Streptomyces sp. NPDC000594]|uniref:TetR/AcrR family transcriptional regulator n=1 Tax=Streptomyces sp. NPDC000594 TaxID=3154261 RepID=UPI00332D92BF